VRVCELLTRAGFRTGGNPEKKLYMTAVLVGKSKKNEEKPKK
jgi:hypothetical protein